MLDAQSWLSGSVVDERELRRAHLANIIRHYAPADLDFFGVSVQCPAGVFQPRVGSSTVFFASHFDVSEIESSSRVCEIGSGCGALLIWLAKQVDCQKYLGVDVNGNAVRAAVENGKRNSVDVEFFLSDIFQRLADQLFDVVIFNAPLMNTEIQSDVEKALCDPHGETFARFLSELKTHLAPHGRAFITMSCQNKYGLIEECGYKTRLVAADVNSIGFRRSIVKLSL
jgi:methylase of polypeptide subunit release factors